jgi:hypothetical protein
MSEALPFMLAAWIKREQAEIAAHKEKMALKRQREDKEYMRFLSFIVHAWSDMSVKEKLFIQSLANRNASGITFTTGQRSAIAGLLIKHEFVEAV